MNATARLADFESHHGALAVDFAAHAAVAVAVTPDLLHVIRTNFFLAPPHELEYEAEARLLLSSLCREVDRDLYEIEAATRAALLIRLEDGFGPQRLHDVARLLLQFSERGAPWSEWVELERAQQLTAWNFLDPTQAVKWLDGAEKASGVGGSQARWYVAMRADLARVQDRRSTAPPSGLTADTTAVRDALLRLGFEEQVAVFNRAIESSDRVAGLISGPPQFGQRWLADRLATSIGAEVLYFTFHVGDESIDEVFARSSTSGGDDPLGFWIDWIGSESQERNLAVIVDRADAATSRAVHEVVTRFWSEIIHRRGEPRRRGPRLVLLVLDHQGRARLPEPLLPALRHVRPSVLLAWLREVAPAVPAEVVASPRATVRRIMAKTEGVPERVLREVADLWDVGWEDLETPWSLATLDPNRLPGPVAALAEEYDGLRADLPFGPERTARQAEIAERMRGLVVPDDLMSALTASGSGGQRLIATVRLQAVADRAYLTWLADRFMNDFEFIQYQAAVALVEAAENLDESALDEVEGALRRAGELLTAPRSDRAEVLEQAGRLLADRGASPRAGPLPFKLWEPGTTLRVTFLDGAAGLRKKVEKVAREWTRWANIDFEFLPPELTATAQIRISFKADSGSWSALGTDALRAEYFDAHQPTANFGWLTENTDEREIARVVLHEFGHVLGLIEEHKQPDARLAWNKDAVYEALTGPPNYWSKAQVDENILRPYQPSPDKPYRPFDKHSIMLFTFPKSMFTDGTETVQGSELSASDKAFIALLYPGRGVAS